jgi:glyoxylase-like metal-dependent hydrolase (beta-lactamase superfamily II)
VLIRLCHVSKDVEGGLHSDYTPNSIQMITLISVCQKNVGRTSLAEDIYHLGEYEVVAFELGMALTNTYLIGVPGSDHAVVIDPAWQGDRIAKVAHDRNWRIGSIWLTHAHFDHFGGAAGVADAYDVPIPVALHAQDQPIWRAMGGATWFGFQAFDPGPEPTIDLVHGMKLHLDDLEVEVRHTPGHSPGHVILLAAHLGAVFSGDLIFQGSVGRTDLPSWDTLLKSIQDEILCLPDETRIFPGHGPPTTVGVERQSNPFLHL